MPASYLNFPYDPELFLMQWQNWPDPVKTALLDSGAVSNDARIRGLIANGSDVYTIPYYNTLGGTPDNYDGATDITMDTPDGASQSGIVFGRAHSWKDTDFVHDFNSGADPMRQITSQVGKYWSKQRQQILIGILGAIFGITDDTTDNWDKWETHTLNIATSTTSVTEANKVGAASCADAMQQAVGDNASIFSLMVMHSKVATDLATLQLLNYRKYTDAMGIERTIGIADYNGQTVIIDDGVPVSASASASGEKEYTSFILGLGSILTAPAPVEKPVEIGREAIRQGGYNYYITRLRETLHPNGFTFVAPGSNYTKSPTNAQLSAAANWRLAGDPDSIAIARIISNG